MTQRLSLSPHEVAAARQAAGLEIDECLFCGRPTEAFGPYSKEDAPICRRCAERGEWERFPTTREGA